MRYFKVVFETRRRGKMKAKFLLAPIIIMLLLLVAGVVPASADSITYIITAPNTALSCCTGPYATVTVTLTSSTTADVTFNSLTNGGFTYLMAGNSAAAVNVNASSFSVSSIAGSNSFGGFSASSLSNGGSGNADGFGTFNLNLNAFDGFNHSSTTISFTLTDTSGTWASAADVLANNANGSLAAIHGFACAAPCTVTEGAFATGYAAQVPEPSSLLLLGGSGLVGLSSFVRRKLRG
jgi:hypothetical protein